MKNNHRDTPTRFAALVQPHAADLYRTAYRLTGNATDAEDLTQDLLVKLFERFEQWQHLANPQPWMKRVLFNLFIDIFRKRKRTHGINPATLNPNADALSSLPSEAASPDDTLRIDRNQRAIRDALDALNLDERTLIVLHFMEGLTLEEVSHVMDVPLGTLKSRLHRSKARLKVALKTMEPFFDNERLPSREV